MMTSLLPAKRSSSFLLVFLLILGSLAIQGCPFYTGVPAIDIANVVGGVIIYGQPDDRTAEQKQCNIYWNLFQGSKILKWSYQRYLRQGERVLFHKGWSKDIPYTSGGYVLITNERVIHYDSDESEDCVDVELSSIQRISQINDHNKFCLKLYDGRLFTIFTYLYNHKDSIEVIRTQVEYINSIRDDLGIVIPPNIETSELDKLNEIVLNELRDRRDSNH